MSNLFSVCRLIVLINCCFSMNAFAQVGTSDSDYQKYFNEMRNVFETTPIDVYTLEPRQILGQGDQSAQIYDARPVINFQQSGMSNSWNTITVVANVVVDLYAFDQLFIKPDAITYDKAKHFVAGYLIGNGTTGFLQLVIPRENKHRKLIAALGGIGASFAIGGLKEWYDANNYGDADVNDFLATGWGGFAGTFVISLSDVQQLFQSKKKHLSR